MSLRGGGGVEGSPPTPPVLLCFHLLEPLRLGACPGSHALAAGGPTRLGQGWPRARWATWAAGLLSEAMNRTPSPLPHAGRGHPAPGLPAPGIFTLVPLEAHRHPPCPPSPAAGRAPAAARPPPPVPAGPAQSGILVDREAVSLFLHFTVNPKPRVDFIDRPRCCLRGKECSINRFQQVESRWGYSGTSDRIRWARRGRGPRGTGWGAAPCGRSRGTGQGGRPGGSASPVSAAQVLGQQAHLRGWLRAVRLHPRAHRLPSEHPGARPAPVASARVPGWTPRVAPPAPVGL